ncbi:hypothetical protein J7E66_22450, partial [Bacillus sp. ISL-7]|nr:hypothetical protein [Bacillus sp. ISL-7]
EKGRVRLHREVLSDREGRKKESSVTSSYIVSPGLGDNAGITGSLLLAHRALLQAGHEKLTSSYKKRNRRPYYVFYFFINSRS